MAPAANTDDKTPEVHDVPKPDKPEVPEPVPTAEPDTAPKTEREKLTHAVAQAEADLNAGMTGPPQKREPRDLGGSKVLTGLNSAYVNVKSGNPIAPINVVEVHEGDTLPANLAEGELDRLKALGAFGPHPRDVRAEAMRAARAMAGPDAIAIVEPDTAAMTAAIARIREEHNASEPINPDLDPARSE